MSEELERCPFCGGKGCCNLCKSEQVTPEQAEAYVRERWPYLKVFQRTTGYGVVELYPSPFMTYNELAVLHGKTQDEAILAAYAFTKEHEQKIAELEEEIAVLRPFAKGRTEEALQEMPIWAKDTIPALLAAGRAIERTIDRLQQQLTTLRKGMKETQA